MGSRLASAAIQRDGLSKSARLVLVRMALLAKDTDSPPIYFGGWPFLAGCLGHDSYTPVAKSAVSRAVRELVTAGAIKPLGAPGPRHNVSYQLRL